MNDSQIAPPTALASHPVPLSTPAVVPLSPPDQVAKEVTEEPLKEPPKVTPKEPPKVDPKSDGMQEPIPNDTIQNVLRALGDAMLDIDSILAKLKSAGEIIEHENGFFRTV